MEYRRTLTAAEQGILRDAYRTLERFAAPPPAKGEPARAYWQRVARDTEALVHRSLPAERSTAWNTAAH